MIESIKTKISTMQKCQDLSSPAQICWCTTCINFTVISISFNITFNTIEPSNKNQTNPRSCHHHPFSTFSLILLVGWLEKIKQIFLQVMIVGGEESHLRKKQDVSLRIQTPPYEMMGSLERINKKKLTVDLHILCWLGNGGCSRCFFMVILYGSESNQKITSFS